jgi:tetratricopeptide (TPR) repeat protein
MMQYSTYSLLIHVGYISHSHNLLLDLAVEQGLLGALAYAALVITGVVWGLRALRAAEREDPARVPALEAALASLAVIVAHGLVDDVIYGSNALLLLLVPFGLLLSAGRRPRTAPPARSAVGPAVTAGLVLTALLVLLAALGPNGLRAAWHANLGAVAQARRELGAYDSFHRDTSLAELRRQLDLTSALTRYRRALDRDPTHPTARQRLAMIALPNARYAAALTHTERLWQAGHRDRVTRLLYGDALVAAGRIDDAVPVLDGLLFARERLLGQAWAYRQRGDTQREAHARAAAARLTPTEPTTSP